MSTSPEEFMLSPKEMNEGKELLYSCDFAVVCFCPLPKTFLHYKYDTYTQENDNRPFTHVKSDNIMYCFSEGFTFIVLSEIYGGPVGSATLEDLHYYGINKVYAFGFAGALNNKFKIGENVHCTSALPSDGVTEHYAVLKYGEHIFPPEQHIELKYAECAVWTIDHFYRQTREQIEEAQRLGCDIVNMDTSFFFAVCKSLGMVGRYFATISDSYAEKKWTNCLTTAISGKGSLITDNQGTLIRNVIYTEVWYNMSPYIKTG
jgi:uridine phosphorylase